MYVGQKHGGKLLSSTRRATTCKYSVIAGTDPDTSDEICTDCKLHIQESCLSGLPTPLMDPCLSVDAHLFVTQS